MRYAGAAENRLTYDWTANVQTGDSAIRNAVEILRSRSREQERNACFYRRFLSALENNVLGADGINLQMKIKFSSGRFDTSANNAIESAWAKWGRAENCSLNKDDDWIGIQKLMLRSCARDGSVLLRMHRGRDLNPFGFALQPIEIDFLDLGYNEYLPNGNEVRMGIERDKRGRIMRYHLLDRHPGDYIFPQVPRVDRITIPASEIIHYFVKERITQSVGTPWGSAAITKLHHLSDYQEYELLASKAGAAKGGWFQSDRGDQFMGDSEVNEDSAGNATTNTLNDFEPQSFDQLPAGMTFHEYNPNHPVDAYSDFVVTALQELSAGLDLDYATLTGDLSKANYSSMRSGKLEVWETYRKIQGHFISKICIPIFEQWLQMAMLSNQLSLPISKFDKFNVPKFRGRRWAWVDPQKDVESALTAINGGIQTRTDVIAQNGGDYEDTMNQLAEEKRMESELGLVFAADKNTPAQQPAQAETEEEEPEENEPEEETEPQENGRGRTKDLLTT